MPTAFTAPTTVSATAFAPISTFGSENYFGVEVEAYYPESWDIPVGRYHCGVQVEELPTGWLAERDSSISDAPVPHFRGIEIKSPKLKGEAGLQELKSALEFLKSKGGIVDRKCGLHISINLPAGNRDWRNLRKLVSSASFLEEALYAIAGDPNRKGNHYCKSIRNNVRTKGRIYREMNRDRYFHLNLTNVGGQHRVEFRCFGGTLDPLTVITYVNVAMAIIERGLRAKCTPKLNPRPIHKGGNFVEGNEELTEANRLISYISWRKGDAKAHGKPDEPFGIIGTIYSPKAMMARIKELARKMHQDRI